MDETIKLLRIYFRASNAAYRFADAIRSLNEKVIFPNKMQSLHKIALIEIEKENPDMNVIDALLLQMKELAKKNSEPKPNFEKGGI